MNIFFTADEHFDHENPNTGRGIIQFCNRPYANIDEHNEAFIKNWNGIVTGKDLVYLLGDFAWRRHLHFLMALNGKKVLIKGNHDKANMDVYKNFTEVHQILQKSIDGKMVIMCHFPLRSWNARTYNSWHFFGHVHGRFDRFQYGLSLDVGVDSWNYTPVPWETLREKMQAIQDAQRERRQLDEKPPVFDKEGFEKACDEASQFDDETEGLDPS